MTVHFELLRKPSNSKGWVRYSAKVNGSPIIQSRTGNEWVSADHAGDVDAGSEIQLTVQTMLRHGKGRTAREEIETETYTMIARDADTCDIGTSVSYVQIRVTGASR